MESITTWERRHKRCLTVRDGKPYYDWTKAAEAPPPGWPNGIVGRLSDRSTAEHLAEVGVVL
jgi:hypothetical protein